MAHEATIRQRTTRQVVSVLRTLSLRYRRSKKNASDRSTPYEILIATVLSARTKDETTHRVADRLFSRYTTPRSLARARVRDVMRIIRSIGFFRVKAHNIIRTARLLVSRYRGRVPNSLKPLMALPGVGRKTANIVLSSAFGVPAIAVDVHVHRISNRVGWIRTRVPRNSEAALRMIVPRTLWSTVNDVFVKFGKDICRPVAPQCWRCPVRQRCRYEPKTVKPAGNRSRKYARVSA